MLEALIVRLVGKVTHETYGENMAEPTVKWKIFVSSNDVMRIAWEHSSVGCSVTQAVKNFNHLKKRHSHAYLIKETTTEEVLKVKLKVKAK